QGARTRALAEFKSGYIAVLVATDIDARGLDIELLPQVENFEMPNVPADHLLLVGRIGRAGATADDISLVRSEEPEDLVGIESMHDKSIERRVLAGFEPQVAVPESRPRAPRKPKKAKDPKGFKDTFDREPRAPGADRGQRRPQGDGQRRAEGQGQGQGQKPRSAGAGAATNGTPSAGKRAVGDRRDSARPQNCRSAPRRPRNPRA